MTTTQPTRAEQLYGEAHERMRGVLVDLQLAVERQMENFHTGGTLYSHTIYERLMQFDELRGVLRTLDAWQRAEADGATPALSCATLTVAKNGAITGTLPCGHGVDCIQREIGGTEGATYCEGCS